MELYSYKAIDQSGNPFEGTYTARSEGEVLNLLRQKNLIPLLIVQGKNVSVKNLSKMSIGLKKKIKIVDMTTFCRQLATMLKAGLALDRAMSIQIAQTENPSLKAALTKLDVQVRQGVPMSKAMTEQPEVFSRILINMVEAGETTGQIDESLERMAVQLEKENKINRRVKGAMIYPVMLLIMTLLVAVGLIVFVIPIFTDIFEGAGNQLPGITQALVDLSQLMGTYWYVFIIAAMLLVYMIKAWLSSEKGRYIYDSAKLQMPIVAKPMTQIVTARFTRTLSTMLNSGIPLIQALGSAAETSNNAVVSERIAEATIDIKSGAPLSAKLKSTGLFPEMMISLISIGEETGELDDMLEKTADYYNDEFESAISKLLSMLEPLMILFMAVIIGTIVIAMYLPMFELSSNV